MDTSDMFCLRWDSRRDTFARIKDYGQFFDCTLTTDDNEAYTVDLRAHKVILAACSEFFGNILTRESMSMHPNPLIYIKGISTRDIQNILHFIYNGEVNMARKEVDNFLEVAETLKIKGLMKGPIGTLVKPPGKGKMNLDIAPSPSLLQTEEHFKTGSGPSEPLANEDSEVGEDEVAINEEVAENFKAEIKEGTDDPVSLAEGDDGLDKLCSEPTSLGNLLAERFRALKSSSSALPHEQILSESSGYCEVRDKNKGTESCPDVKETKDSFNDAIFNDLVEVDANNVYNEEMQEDSNEKEEGVLGENKSEGTCNISGSSKSPQHNGNLQNIHHTLGKTGAEGELLKENDQDEQNRFVSKKDGKKYHCEQCSYSNEIISNEKASLRKHIEGVHEENENVCKECGYAASNKGLLNWHIKGVHSKEKPYKCELCPYKTSRKANLKKHVEGKHEKTGSYVCEECGYVASKNSKLKLHRISVHKMGDKIFQCDQCPYTTGSKGSLKTHVDTMHKKIKNHVCEVCGYAVSRKMALIMHRQTEHKIGDLVQLECEKCPFTTFSKKSFKTHIAAVHEKASIRPKACTYCNKEFSKYSSMVAHRKVAHREQWNIDKERIMVEEGGYADPSDYLKKSQAKKKSQQKCPCTVCGRVLCSRNQLHLHMKALHGTGLPDYKPKSK